MLPRIKYVAAYQSQPVSAITHVAPVASIEPYGEDGKFKLIFAEPAKQIEPIPFANAPADSMQGPRYSTYARLRPPRRLPTSFRRGEAINDQRHYRGTERCRPAGLSWQEAGGGR
jgi:hypothetical protein